MQIVHFPLRQLIPFAENPRVKKGGKSREALMASIRAFGLFKPSLVWVGEDHPQGVTGPIVIGGNQRLATLLEMDAAGMFADGPLAVTLGNGAVVTVDPEAIPCVVFPGSWPQAKVVALRDNAEDGEWDWDALPAYVKELEGLFPEGIDLTLTGFTSQTLADLEALASDPLVGLDRFRSDGGVEVEDQGGQGQDQGQTAPSTSPGDGKGSERKGDGDASFLTRQGARVVLGNIRGKIDVATYERWAAIVKDASTRLGTTDLQIIMADLAGRLETWTAPKGTAKKRAGGEG